MKDRTLQIHLPGSIPLLSIPSGCKLHCPFRNSRLSHIEMFPWIKCLRGGVAKIPSFGAIQTMSSPPTIPTKQGVIPPEFTLGRKPVNLLGLFTDRQVTLRWFHCKVCTGRDDDTVTPSPGAPWLCRGSPFPYSPISASPFQRLWDHGKLGQNCIPL